MKTKRKDIMYFALTYLGIPYNLTRSNLQNYLYFGCLEGYELKELMVFINKA